MNNIDKVYSASAAGTTYLKERYAEFSNKFDTSLLGVRDPGFITKPSTDKVFRIVSCSRISPEKRLELLLEGIAAAARRRPEQRFEWHHIGNGDQKDALQKQIDASFPLNGKGYLHKFSDGNALMDFYRDHPIDIFANSSSTEGTSVAIMEAMSCGIPVLATSVGGNVEIVSEQNGRLVPAESLPDDIAAGLLVFMYDDASPLKRRAGSRQKWSAEYNADVNFPEFARNLRSIRLEKMNTIGDFSCVESLAFGMCRNALLNCKPCLTLSTPFAIADQMMKAFCWSTPKPAMLFLAPAQIALSQLGLGRIEEMLDPRFDLFFGFRRLSILDLSPAGHQPMRNADGSLWIVFNGEIYNYIELRSELKSLGYVFPSALRLILKSFSMHMMPGAWIA